MEINRDNIIMLALAGAIGTGGGTGIGQIFEAGEDREEIAQWEAIKERVTNKDLEIFFLRKGCP